MRIAVWHELGPGGGLRALVQQVDGLAGRGYDVTVFSPPWADGDPRFSEPVGERAVSASAATNRWGPLWLTPPRRRAQLEASERAADAISRGGFDVLLAHPSGISAVPPIGAFVDLPSVLYLQEPNRRMYEAEPVLPWLPTPTEGGHRGLRRWARDLARLARCRKVATLEQRDARAFDLILVNSHFSRESILRSYGCEAEVCYLGVDPERFRASGAEREPFVMGVGRIQPRKRIEVVIGAVAEIPEERRPALRWIGDGADSAYLKMLVDLARGTGVEFEPQVAVSDDALIDAMGRATALVYAPRLEPFGFAPIEAGACELPIVAVAEGGVRETVVHGVNGLLTTSTGFAATLDALLQSPEQQRLLGQAGRRLALERWSVEGATSRIETVLLRVTGTGGGSGKRADAPVAGVRS